MADSRGGKAFEEVVRKVAPACKLLRTWELKGGVSAQVTALEVERPDGQTMKMIVRQHGDADLRRNPEIAADEFKLLQALQSVGLPTPAPLYLDQSGEIFSSPYVVVEYIEGASEFAPSNFTNTIQQLATHLVRIHDVDCMTLELSFLPGQEAIYTELLRRRPTRVSESLDEGRIRDSLETVWPLPRRNEPVLLHGDFWPGNTLWRNSQLVAVIDWEDAAFGDPLADLANSRLEILWAFGVDAMHGFTHRYQSMRMIDIRDLPYWDLCAALRPAAKIADWALDDRTEVAMRDGLRWFIAQALEKVSGQ